jgi:hypothetical protein
MPPRNGRAGLVIIRQVEDSVSSNDRRIAIATMGAKPQEGSILWATIVVEIIGHFLTRAAI